MEFTPGMTTCVTVQDSLSVKLPQRYVISIEVQTNYGGCIMFIFWPKLTYKFEYEILYTRFKTTFFFVKVLYYRDQNDF